MGWIYIWKCKPTGKMYVGQTTKTTMERWASHVWNATAGFESYKKNQRNPFSRAIRKYGPDAFELFAEYEYVDELLDDYEIFYIMYYKAEVPNGYNISKGGQNTPWENNKFYLIDAATKETIMYANSKYIIEYLGIDRSKWSNYAYCTYHVVAHNKLYYILKDLIDISDWCTTPEAYKECRDKIHESKILTSPVIAINQTTNETIYYSTKAKCVAAFGLDKQRVNQYIKDGKWHKVKQLQDKYKFMHA